MRIKAGDKLERVVPGTEVRECPVSYITPKSLQLLELVAGSRSMHQGVGACMYGPDVNKWPAWWFDACAAVESAKAAEEIARDEALKNNGRN